MEKIINIIITSIMTSIVNVFIGFALTPFLIKIGQEQLVSILWLIILIGIPTEIIVILKMLKII